jgi:sugar/nucleoside kinase (ribokinase family)
MQQDGIRILRPLADAPSWFGCFDIVQLNEEEMQQLTPDPLSLSAQALGAGVSLLAVTLGPRGVAYVAAPGFDGLGDRRTGGQADRSNGLLLGVANRPADRPSVSPTVRSALIPAPSIETLDPTGCGDVFGATCFARLLAGESVEAALRQAARLAARNAAFRGASGLARHLRGELVSP